MWQPGREDVPKQPRSPDTPVIRPSLPRSLAAWTTEEVGYHCRRCGKRETFARTAMLATYGDLALTPLLTGWVTREDIHLLSPPALRARAAGNPALAAVLAHAAATLYTRRVLIEANHDLHQARAARRTLAARRWAWLLEGGARWFSGEARG